MPDSKKLLGNQWCISVDTKVSISNFILLLKSEWYSLRIICFYCRCIERIMNSRQYTWKCFVWLKWPHRSSIKDFYYKVYQGFRLTKPNCYYRGLRRPIFIFMRPSSSILSKFFPQMNFSLRLLIYCIYALAHK